MQLSDSNAERSAWIGWFVLSLVTAAIIASGSSRTVVPAYHDGAVDWIAGKTLFAHTGVGGFIYLPQAAILFIPLALLPVVAGEVLWRFVSIGVFAFGIFHFARLVRGSSGKGLFPLMTLVIVLALLVLVIDRPLFWRLPAGMLVTALFPFLTQHPGYVLDQYAAFWSSLTKAVHVGAVDKGWTTPFNALRLAGVSVSEKGQTLLRLAAAFGTLALCWLSRRRHDAVRSAVFVFSLSIVYLMLFSPRTENNTYAMLGPAIAVFLAGAYLIEQQRGEVLLLSCMAGAILGGRVIERLLTPLAGTSWVSPLMAACFAAYLMVRFFRDMQEPREQGQ